MKYISPLFSDARNKLGGTVFARNRSGTYARAKTIPAQPRTPSQVDNRTAFGSLATQWKALTQAQIVAWNNYAATLTLVDSLGHSFRPSGIQAFISAARYRGFIGGDPLVTPPTTRLTFPNVFPFDWQIFNLPGIDFSMQLVAPIDWGSWGDWCVASCTPALSPGITFVRRTRYRRLIPSYTSFSNVIDVTANYLALFPQPADGARVGLRFQLVDPTSGIASPAYDISTIVTT